MRQSTRLVRNVGSLFVKTFLQLALMIWVTRIIFTELGDIDYGIFAAIGATGGLLMVFTAALTDAVSRHMAFHLGREEIDQVAEFYNTSLVVYSGLGIVLILIGFSCGNLVASVLNVEGREHATAIAFAGSMCVLGIKCIETPFQAAANAYQNQLIEAFFSSVNAVLRLIAALLLVVIASDRLIAWSWLLVAGQLLQTSATILTVMKYHPMSRPRLGLFRRSRLRDLVSFGGWTILEAMSWRIRNQGGQILLNKMFGPVVNTSYGIGTQLAGYQRSLAAPIQRAAMPVMVSSYGGKKASTVRDLTMMTGKYLFWISALFVVPLLFEYHTLLGLWLGKARVENLVALDALIPLIAISLMYKRLGDGFTITNRATGKIAIYTSILFLLEVVSLVFAYALIKFLGYGPGAVPFTATVSVICQVIFSAWFVSRAIGLTMTHWIVKCVVPAHVPLVAAVLACLGISYAMEPGLLRLLVIGAVSTLIISSLAWCFGMEQWEQAHYRRMVNSIVRRISGKGPAKGEQPVSQQPDDTQGLGQPEGDTSVRTPGPTGGQSGL